MEYDFGPAGQDYLRKIMAAAKDNAHVSSAGEVGIAEGDSEVSLSQVVDSSTVYGAVARRDVPVLVEALRETLRQGVANIPAELRAHKAWVCWKVTEIDAVTGKFNKIPHYPGGAKRQGEQGSAADRARLGTFEQAIAAFENNAAFAGIGLAMLPDLGLVAFDADKCRHDGVLRQDVTNLIELTYAEVSPSETGIRAFWKGAADNGNNKEQGFELYAEKQFVTVTGNVIGNTFALLGGGLPDLDASMRQKLETLCTATRKSKGKSAKLKEVASDDSILQHLIKLEMVEKDMGGGKFSILCPFEQGHSDPDRAGGDADTAYFLPHTNGYVQGHFHCTHASCGHRTDGDYLEAIGYQQDVFDDLTAIADDSPPATTPTGSLDLDDLFNELALTQEDVAAMADAEFLIDNLVVRGGLHAIVAPANGGKTTLFIYLCEDLAARGMKILYVNADGSPSDLKRHFAHSAEHGYTVLAPDAKVGKGPKDIIDKLQKLNNSATDLGNVVIILDTLKKFTAMINKANLRAFLGLMRGVSTKGATVILLGHTNKYPGDDGKIVFEGTGDLRNDVDHLIYLESSKDEAKRRQEITTRPDKVRATFKPVSYVIDLDSRLVERSDRVLIVVSQDERVIAELATESIKVGQIVQSKIVDRIKREHPEIGVKKIINTLHKLSAGDARLFNVSEGANNNAKVYSFVGVPEDLFSDVV